MANTSAVLKQALVQEDLTTRDLQPRTDTLQPLLEPAGGSAVAYAVWFKDISDKADKNVGFLTLTPSDAQVETWKVKYRREEIPIGATGLWRPFGK